MPRYDDDEDDDLGPPDEPQPNTCPQCGSRRSKKISFTMWGGAVGPAVFGLVKCKECDQQYMKKSGKPFEWSHILAYTAVVTVIAIGLLGVLLVLAG
jgi:ribosomal protein L37AE/L43A